MPDCYVLVGVFCNKMPDCYSGSLFSFCNKGPVSLKTFCLQIWYSRNLVGWTKGFRIRGFESQNRLYFSYNLYQKYKRNLPIIEKILDGRSKIASWYPLIFKFRLDYFYYYYKFWNEKYLIGTRVASFGKQRSISVNADNSADVAVTCQDIPLSLKSPISEAHC